MVYCYYTTTERRNNEKKLFFSFLFTVILTGFAFSQSNELIDTLLDEQSAGFGNTAYMVLSAASIIDESSTIQDAVDILSGDDWKNFEGKKKLRIRLPSENIPICSWSLSVYREG